MEVLLSTQDEISALTNISKNAFLTDVNVGSPESGGPPEYDSERWHMKMLKTGNLYSIKNNGELVGGLLVFKDRKDPGLRYLGRIFMDPLLHRKGLGSEAMRKMEELFPDATMWRLDTPAWNTRTNAFYIKNGFVEMYRDKGFVFFQKTISRS